MIQKPTIVLERESDFLAMKFSADRKNTTYRTGSYDADPQTCGEGETPDIMYQSAVYMKDVGKIWLMGGIFNTSEGGITIDSSLDKTSTNPVQNKVVTSKLNEKFGGIIYGDDIDSPAQGDGDGSGLFLFKPTDSTTFYFLQHLFLAGWPCQYLTTLATDPNESYTEGDGTTLAVWRRLYRNNKWGKWTKMPPVDVASTSENGLMSSDDKSKLDNTKIDTSTNKISIGDNNVTFTVTDGVLNITFA